MGSYLEEPDQTLKRESEEIGCVGFVLIKGKSLDLPSAQWAWLRDVFSAKQWFNFREIVH
jgi:hypothetical protein